MVSVRDVAGLSRSGRECGRHRPGGRRRRHALAGQGRRWRNGGGRRALAAAAAGETAADGLAPAVVVDGEALEAGEGEAFAAGDAAVAARPLQPGLHGAGDGLSLNRRRWPILARSGPIRILPSKTGRSKNIIARRAATLAPLSLDIGSRVIRAHLLAMAINASVGGINSAAARRPCPISARVRIVSIFVHSVDRDDRSARWG